MARRPSATFTIFTISRGADKNGDCADSQKEKLRGLGPKMRAREIETDDGIKIYCSDVKRGIHCPYTDEFVSITETCLGCEKIYKDDPYYFYCIRGSSTTAKRDE